jgi:ClpP class serine protease
MTTKQQPGPRPIIPLGDLWAMEETAFQQLGELLQRVDLTALLAGRAPSRWERLVEVTDDGLGIVEIAGLLVKAHTIFGWFFRETAYPDIQHAIEELSRRRDVKKIVLLVDSPGGTVAGVAEAADAIFLTLPFSMWSYYRRN